VWEQDLLDGRYKRVGTLGGLSFAYRLVPLSAGQARWETCTAIGGIVSSSSVVTSTDGLVESPARTVSEDETDTVCRWPGEYTWEICALDQLRSTGGCSWARRSWGR